MSRKPTENIDYTSRDYEAFRTLLIQKLQEKMPEYTDTSSTDAGIVILEALANGLDILSLYADIIANDVLLPTTQDRKLAILLSKSLGYSPYNQTASVYPQVFVLNGVKDKNFPIPKGTVVKTKDSNDLATLYFETTKDFFIPAGKIGNEKGEDGKYLYTVPIHHGTSVYQDVIGTSSGTPLQSFNLNYTNVLVDSIELLINEGQGEELWTRVDSFLESDETSRVYTVSVNDFDVCTIEFGNGLKGKIPTAYPNGIIANYRVGGGEVGNVSANIITELDSNIIGISETFNLEATVLGHEKESLESIKENAPAVFRTRDRIVALDDYTDLLRINFYDFLQLKTVRDGVDKKLVHIYYMLRKGYGVDNDEVGLGNKMTEELASQVTKFIAEKSMVGTTYDIQPYVEESVDFDCVMYVDRDYSAEVLKADVLNYFETVTFYYGELKFEDSIIKSDLESEIKNVFDGVLSFRINTPTEDILFPSRPECVLTKGIISIETRYL